VPAAEPKMRLFPFALLMFITFHGMGQKVAVVMSGGGSKGMAHIGMLKALEEYEIPIDYVVGTSMGGIIAGCYAAGMSPAQIQEIMLSDNLRHWVNGQLEDGYNYYYNKGDDNPTFVKINLSLDSTLNFNFNSTLAKDLSLNFAMAEKMAQPSAIANGNFDSLFVPLRVVASDIFTQHEVILKDGILSDALRATQTVPFFYDPIRIDGKYLFDGGVYNNFPVTVAQKEFHPDVIIGSNVAGRIYEEYPKGEDDKLISHSLLYLLLDKSNPGDIPASGVYIQPNLKPFSSLDFSKIRAMIDSGYAATVRLMPQIQAKIAGRRNCEDVAASRNKFNNRTSPLLTDNIVMKGFTGRQTRYVNKFFKSGRRPLYFEDVKSGYYRLVSEDYFKNVFPSFSFEPATKHFNFHLTKRRMNNFQVDFGGVIASRNISNIYLGLNYYSFNSILTHTNLNFSTGSFYKSAQLKARLDFPAIGQFYLEPEATFNSWNYIEGTDIIFAKSQSTILSRIDRKIGLSVGKPLGRQLKVSLEAHYISNSDQYIDKDVLVTTDTLDQLLLTGGRYGFHISTNTLNRKQYASTGKSFYLGIDYFDLLEDLKPGTTSTLYSTVVEEKRRNWVRGTLIMEQYFRKDFYSSGYYLHAVFSNQPLFGNYEGTIINAPGFYPMQDSRTILLQNFRAFNFVAGGWRNVFTLRKNLDFRLEGYLFKPLEAIVKGVNQEPVLDNEITKIYFAGTAGLVLHSTVGPISLSVNYYDNNKNQLGVLLHIGFLLFKKTSLE
jgi:NTE family protein